MMNKKVISAFVVLIVTLSIIPMAVSTASISTPTPTQRQPASNSINSNKALDLPAPLHRTGLIWVSPKEYSKLTGRHYPTFNAKAYLEAIESAPFYPGRSFKTGTPASSSGTLPSEVMNTLYLPPVGNQGYVGSCNAWSSTYYVWTYMLNWWRNNPHPSTPDVIMNPTFTYNLINGGGDYGSNMWDAMNLISTIGAVPLDAFPLYVYGPYGDPENYAWLWPNLTQWMMAPHNSGTEDMYWWQYLDGNPGLYKLPGQWYILYMDNDTQWEYLKGLLAEGYVLQTALWVLPSFSFIKQPGKVIEYLQFYAQYAEHYANEYWTNSTYKNWTVGQLLSWVSNTYNETYGLDDETRASLQLMQEILVNKYNVSMNDTILNATIKISQGVEEHYANNETWMQEATFYLSSYSINGEAWLLNHGFDDLYVLANFEWMIHYIPLNEYATSDRIIYINFYNYYYMWQGGHAVTIIGYDDNATTPDGNGTLKMVNSWGTDWGDNGYWDYSYAAARNPGIFSTYVDGLLPVKYFISFGEAFVYVPKATDYKPKVMSIIGIKHPLRGEVIDGIFNTSNFNIITPAGIPVGITVDNQTIWEHSFLDFWSDYFPYFSNVSEMLGYLPQAHPFPNSPMAFDISNALTAINSYVSQSNTTPRYIDFYLNVSDKLPDNITGTLYNFTLMISTPNGPYYISSNATNVTIPDGGWIIKDIKVPLAQYGPETPANRSSVNYGNFSVDIVTLAVPKSATLILGNKTYNLTAENGGYYFYGKALAQKLKLLSGTYNYTVVLNFDNNKTLILPTRMITIKGPTVTILSPEPTIYNTTSLDIKVRITGDGLNITNITTLLNGKEYELIYNSTSGLYEKTLNLTNGEYTFTVKATDEYGNSGAATVQFVVHSGAEIKKVSNTTVGIIGGKASNLTVQNNTLKATVQTSEGNISIEVPLVNNVPSIFINNTALEEISKDKANASLVAGWNVTVSNLETKTEVVKKEEGKKLVSVTIKANVTIGENGVAVLAFKDINISKIKVIKDGQIIFLTTNRSAQIGYYYKENGMVFVVLKEDPIVEVDGQKEVPIILSPAESILMLNFVYYTYYTIMGNTFSKLYQKAEKEGVDKLILAEAAHLKKLADGSFEAAITLTGGNILANLGNPLILKDLRKAYMDLKKAIKLLQDGLKAHSNANSKGSP